VKSRASPCNGRQTSHIPCAMPPDVEHRLDKESRANPQL
jgi:hypothetical protein